MKSIGYKDLKSVAILKEVNETSLNALHSIAKKETYVANDYIVKQNEKAETAFIIIRGTAEVFKISDTGEKEIIVLMGPSDIIGLGDKPSFYETWVRSANIRALEPMILYEFNVHEYLELLKDHPDLMLAFIEISKRMSHYGFIKRLFPFAAFNYRKIRSIANLLIEKEVPKGTTIIQEGDISDICYFILKGQVEVSHEVDEEKHVLKILDAGEILGESSLLINVRRTATVVTTKDCTLLEAKGEDLKKIVYQYTDLSKFYIDIVRQRMRPKRLPSVEISATKGGEKGSSYTLKNPETLSFYQLSNHAYFIWNLLDGEHTIDELNEKFSKEFNTPAGDFVTHLIYDLTMHVFIENPASSLEEIADGQGESKGTLGFFQKLKRRLFK